MPSYFLNKVESIGDKTNAKLLVFLPSVILNAIGKQAIYFKQAICILNIILMESFDFLAN